MTGTSRKLGLVVALSALSPAIAAPSLAAPASAAPQDVQAMFEEGVDLLKRGRDEEALRAFQRVLAANPSHEAAYQLWKSTEHEIWLDILSKEGDLELVGKRLMGLARMGRMERRDDGAAIRELVAQLDSSDPISRRSAIRQLAAEHGAFAVPYLLPALADSGDEDRRVSVMQALTEMGLDVVPPLLAALDAPEAYLRRNVALTLGYIGDARAKAGLAHAAQSDTDTGVRQAAQDALGRMGAQGTNAAAAFVQLGQAYLGREEAALGGQVGDVVWSWEGQALAKRGVPAGVYADEMARNCFSRALLIDASTNGALSGYVRAQIGEVARLEALAASGVEVEEQLAAAHAGAVGVGLAGVAAADKALLAALAARDYAAAGGLVQAVGAMAVAPTEGLRAALRSEDGGLRSSAALALGEIALDTRSAVQPEAVAELAQAVGRQIVRLAFVIDPNEARASTLAAGLRSQGMTVTTAGTGGMGLAMLQRLPGVDVVLVADRLPDMTTDQALEELAGDARHGDTPRLVITEDGDAAGELYGESSSGLVVAGDVSGVSDLLSDNLNADRERADELSRLAAAKLAELASAGADIGSALDALAGTLASRPDAVALPAAHALARAGTGAQVPALVSVVADTTRSEETRAASADALAMIVARSAGQIPAEGQFLLKGVLEADGSLRVRQATARALGKAVATPDERAKLLRGLMDTRASAQN